MKDADGNTASLATSIVSAEHERKVWSGGRRAYREHISTALNPHSPGTSDHALWVDGFEHERMKSRRIPFWVPAENGTRAKAK